MKTEKDLEYYRKNAEEDYLTTPISVLRYIGEMEKALRKHDVVKQSEQLKCPYCGSEEIQIHQDCSTCDECKNMF